MVAPRRTAVHNKKRHGHHQSRSKQFLQVYSPYLPLLVFMGLILLSVFVHLPSHSKSVLGQSTAISPDTLLNDSNSERTAHHDTPLVLNSALSQAAQQKANDMVSRNYWSHVTPSGEQPWQFITRAGYRYTKAGENLAYGFSSSSAVINGWMNSPPHRDNVLDNAYQEVGFGIADSSDFVSNGPETVVVAMYGSTHPLSTRQSSVLSSASTAPQNLQTVSVGITRLEGAIANLPPSLSTFLIIAAAGLLVYETVTHIKAVRQAIKKSQRFALKHPLLDSVAAMLIVVLVLLSRTIGTIR